MCQVIVVIIVEGKRRWDCCSLQRCWNNAIEYLAGCMLTAFTSSSSPLSSLSSSLTIFLTFHLLAGNPEGEEHLFGVDADQITPLAYLKGGHRGDAYMTLAGSMETEGRGW